MSFGHQKLGLRLGHGQIVDDDQTVAHQLEIRIERSAARYIFLLSFCGDPADGPRRSRRRCTPDRAVAQPRRARPVPFWRHGLDAAAGNFAPAQLLARCRTTAGHVGHDRLVARAFR